MIPLLAEIIISGSVVTLQPTEHVGAIAEVVFDNVSLNGPSDNGDYPLSLGGLSIVATFTWDTGDEGQDRITVTPPDGVLCQPSTCVLQVDEGSDGTLILFEWVGF